MQESTKRPFLWLFATLAVVGLVADQASKYVVFAKLYPADTEWETKVEVIPGYFELRTAYTHQRDPGDDVLSFLRTDRLPHVNRGALFGIGNGDPESGGMNGFFAIVSVLAACFIVIWAMRPSVAHDRFLCLALGLILGGTLGNLYDRVVFGGVRDFLHCYYDTHPWPDFNIADACLVCGAGTLLVHSFFVTEPVKAEPSVTQAPVPMQTTSSTPGA
ncbi:MAG: signal peptidase II [Gemmataceae bacterium]|nr:signal peptidase II [Gemmataceae bacterium]